MNVCILYKPIYVFLSPTQHTIADKERCNNNKLMNIHIQMILRCEPVTVHLKYVHIFIVGNSER